MSLSNKSWTIVCISDTHGRHRQLTDRLQTSHKEDILIHAGDITNFGRGVNPFDDFDQWLNELPFKYKLIVGGNHDSILTPSIKNGQFLNGEHILIDDCLCIYGSSWRPVGGSTWSDIPLNAHIVITHNPTFSSNGTHVDLEWRLQHRINQVKPLISVYGHIHEDYGIWKQPNGIIFANAATMPTSKHQTLNDPLKFKISMDENAIFSIEHLI